MLLELIALGVLVLFALLGARRGALATGLSLAGLVAGYAAAVLAASYLGRPVGAALGLPPLLGAPIAGTLAFVFVAADFALVSWILRRRSDAPMTAASRLGGALFGALRGSLVVLLIGFLALWIDAYRQLGPGADPGWASAPADTPLRQLARGAVETGVAATLGDDSPAVGVTVRALTRPAESVEEMRALATTPEIQALASDRQFWAYVESGAVPAALAQPSFQRLQWNVERRRQLAAVGLVDEIAAGDPAIFALAMRGALEQLGPRIRALREDPELLRLAEDPAIAALVEQRDVVGLLTHPGVQSVLARALDGAPPAG